MKKNDLIKTEDGIYRILSIEANRVLAIDCIKKTMPKFYSVYMLLRGKNLETGKYSDETRTQNLNIFKDALEEVMNLNNWHAFLNCVRKFAGVIKNVTKNNDFLLDNFTLRFKNLFQCGSDSWYLYDMIRFAPMDEQEKERRNPQWKTVR